MDDNEVQHAQTAEIIEGNFNVVNNWHLKTYEDALESHLRKVLTRIDEETSKLNEIFKKTTSNEEQTSVEHSSLNHEVQKLRRLSCQNQSKVRDVEENRNTCRSKQASANDELERSRSHLKELIVKEKEVRKDLNTLNQKISNTLTELDTIAWPEKNDVKLLRNIVGKTVSQLLDLEKEKRLQDAYIERLKKDVELAEEEIRRLAETARLIKAEEKDDRKRFLNFYDRLRTFESGTIRLEDHWERLLSTLRSDENQVTFSQREVADVNSGIQKLNNEVPESPLFKHFSEVAQNNSHLERIYSMAKKTQREQRKRIDDKKFKMQYIRQQVNRRVHNIFPQIAKERDEKLTLLRAITNKADDVTKEYNKLRLEKGFRESEQERVLLRLEKIECEKVTIEKRIDVCRELNNQLYNAFGVNRLKQLKKKEKQTRPNSDRQPQKSNSKITDLDKSYNKLRQMITELIRQKIALEYKKDRFRKEADFLKARFKEVRHATELVTREFRELDKHATNPFATDDFESKALLDEKCITLGNRINELSLRKNQVQVSLDKLTRQLHDIRKKCESWRNKIGKLRAVNQEESNEKQLELLNNIHSFQKSHQHLEHQLWKIQKKLEFAVMHRDYDVHKAQAIVLGADHSTTQLQKSLIKNNRQMQHNLSRIERELTLIKEEQ